MSFSVLGVEHTGITVSDLDRSVDFWCDVLGYEVKRRSHLVGPFVEDVTGVPGADLSSAILARPGHRVELLQWHSPAHAPATTQGTEVPGSMHVAFRVDDIDALLDHIRSAGWSGPGQVRTMERGIRAGARFVFVRDPDGTTLEFIEPPSR